MIMIKERSSWWINDDDKGNRKERDYNPRKREQEFYEKGEMDYCSEKNGGKDRSTCLVERMTTSDLMRMKDAALMKHGK